MFPNKSSLKRVNFETLPLLQSFVHHFLGDGDSQSRDYRLSSRVVVAVVAAAVGRLLR